MQAGEKFAFKTNNTSLYILAKPPKRSTTAYMATATIEISINSWLTFYSITQFHITEYCSKR